MTELNESEARLLNALANGALSRFDTMAAAVLLERGLANITGQGVLSITEEGLKSVTAQRV